MFNFKQLVESLLLEQVGDLPYLGIRGTNNNDWVYELLDKHETLFPTATKIPDLNQKVEECFTQALKIGNPRPSKNSVRPCLPLERLYDILLDVRLKVGYTPRSVDVNTFLANSNVQTQGSTIAQTIKNAPVWEVTGPIKIAYNELMNERDLLARAALETYYQQSILNTVNEIVKKRSNAFTKIANLRNPFNSGFTQLIEDALLNPEQYVSGNKKITNDFKNIVDDLFFKQILQVGITAKELFLKESGQPTLNTADYKNFIINKNGGNTVGEINDKGTEESLALIDALKSIAEYERNKAGRGEIAGKVVSTLGALRVGMGPVN